MATRKSLVVKKWGFPAQNGDEKGSRRQKKEFPASKWRREWASSPKKGVFRLKMVTRKGFVVKKWGFPAQNDDEKESRRQKIEFLGSKWRREKGSSPKTRLSDLKTATRKSLVAKKSSFLAKNSDEKRARRQKIKFSAQK